MPDTASPTEARLMGRVCTGLLLDFLALNRGPRKLLDGIILAGIVHANLSSFSRDTGLQRTYATPEAPVPDDLRRPVSVNAIATSLRFPYETVRRRVRIMARDGVCVVTAAGVHVPQAFFATPERLTAARACYERIQAGYDRLRGLGFLADLNAAPALDGEPPVRVVMRLFTEYFLRIIDALDRQFDDPVSGLILLAILRANTAHVSDAERGQEGLSAEDYVPDRLRRPVSTAQMARELGLTPETARRQVNALVAAGRCVRNGTALVLPAETLARPEWAAIMLDNFTQTTRMFTVLASLGITARWDAERARRPAGPLAT